MLLQHKKIRFSRKDVKKLQNFPSACTPDGIKLTHTRKYKKCKPLWRAVRACLFVVFAFFCLTVLILKVGIRGEILVGKMQEIVSEKLGDFATAEIRDARLSLDDHFRIALEAEDVTVHDLKGNVALDHIGSVRVSLSTLALLQGKVRVIGGSVSGTEITVQQNPQNADVAPVQSPAPPIELTAMENMVFPALDSFLRLFDRQQTRWLDFEDITLNSRIGDKESRLSVNWLTVYNNKNNVDIDARLGWQEQIFAVSGVVWRDAQRNGEKFNIKVKNNAFHLGATDGVSPYLPDGRVNSRYFRLRGAASAVLEGTRQQGEAPASLVMSLALANGSTDMASQTDMDTRFYSTMRYVFGNHTLEIGASRVKLGGLDIPFIAMVQRVEPDSDGHEQYKFTALAEDAVSAPQTSPAPPMGFTAKLDGMLKPFSGQVVVDMLKLQSGDEYLAGTGKLRFGEGSPETIFVLQTPSMRVDKVKQLWPANLTPDTRAWVLSHIFGGNIANASMELAFPSGFFKPGAPPLLMSGKELKLQTELNNVRSDLIGELPPLREAFGRLTLDGSTTQIDLERATAYIGDGRSVQVTKGKMLMPWRPGQQLVADLSVHVTGEATAMGVLTGYKPVNIVQKIPFDMQETTGNIDLALKLNFPMGKHIEAGDIVWNADFAFKDFSLRQPFQDKITVANANGHVYADQQEIVLDSNVLLNDVPAHVDMAWSLKKNDTQSTLKPLREKITLSLDNALRKKLFSGLESFIDGIVSVDVGPEQNGQRHIIADLSKAGVEIPWIGWKKGTGIAATAEMTVPAAFDTVQNMEINDFHLKGASFEMAGRLDIRNRDFSAATFSKIVLNNQDNVQLSVKKNGNDYQVNLSGKMFDARSVIKQFSSGMGAGGGAAEKLAGAVTLHAKFDKVSGFYNETLSDFTASYQQSRAGDLKLDVKALAQEQYSVSAQFLQQKGTRMLQAEALDAGAFMRFMNFYDKAHGGRLEARLNAQNNAPLSGPVSLYNFQIVNEPKLASIVSSKPVEGGKSLNDSVKERIDVAQVVIERAFSRITKGDNFLAIDRGVVRGPTIGATFQGIVYDSRGNIAMTGTFMPAYGLNRIFGNLPIIGAVLGNGRDGGLIGITFKVEGEAKTPRVVVNPISAIAPGVFRSIFEFK